MADENTPEKPVDENAGAPAEAPQETAAPAATESAPKPAAEEKAKPAKEGKPSEGEKATAGEAAAPASDDAKEEAARPAAPSAEELLKEEIGAIKIRKAKGSKNITSALVHIQATFNNTLVSITDLKGNLISWSSAGKCNFRGSRKSTAYAGQVVAQDAARVAMSHGVKDVIIHVKGPGMGRDSAVRAFQAIGLEINSIIDVTPIPHNGCRPPKRRRV